MRKGHRSEGVDCIPVIYRLCRRDVRWVEECWAGKVDDGSKEYWVVKGKVDGVTSTGDFRHMITKMEAEVTAVDVGVETAKKVLSIIKTAVVTVL